MGLNRQYGNPRVVSAELLSEFFELGQLESSSPFLLQNSRLWGINLTLKSSLLAAVFLLFSFICSFYPSAVPIGHVCLVFVYFLAGIPSLIEAIEDLINGEINIDILMTLAAFSSIFIGSGMEGGLLLVLFSLSGAMEDAVSVRAKGALSSLYKLSPTKASVVQSDGSLMDRSVNDITTGTHILVKAGQVVPLDGIVIRGISSVNLVHLTGENLPVTKGIGDSVPAGGRNLEGALTIEVIHTSADSTLAFIIELVTRAEEARPPLQRWFDRLSRTYAMSIIALSGFFAISLPYVLNIPFLGVEGGLYRALTFLIAASPCALIIAIPIAYLSAVSSCARRGILLKGGASLDALASCQAVAFDKTGTLTTGQLICTAIEPLTQNSSIDSQTALMIAYAMEKNAVHPIAAAIMEYGMALKVQNHLVIDQFKSVPGYGLEGVAELTSGRKNVYIGRPNYIAEQLPSDLRQELLTRVREIEESGELLAVLAINLETAVQGNKVIQDFELESPLVGVDHSSKVKATPTRSDCGSKDLVNVLPSNAVLRFNQEIFIFHFSDTPRKNVNQMLQALEKRGLSTVMLTGDHVANAKRIAKELGVSEVHAGLTPEQKLNYVGSLSETKKLAMIGDGVNDAPALARATVGICMGQMGSTPAIDASDIILLHDNIERLDWLFEKAHQTKVIVKQNLCLAVGAILIASLPALGGIVPLWLAVVMHEGGTILVGLNALRLLRS